MGCPINFYFFPDLYIYIYIYVCVCVCVCVLMDPITHQKVGYINGNALITFRVIEVTYSASLSTKKGLFPQ